MSDDLDPQRYAAALRAHEQVFASLHDRLGDGVDGWRPDLGLDALRDDLTALATPRSAPVRSAPIEAAAARWGALYVVEGSRLGARQMLPHLELVVPGAPRRYFRHAAADAPARWRRFRLAIEAAVSAPADVDLAVAAAVDVFAEMLDAARHGRLEPESVG